MQLWSKIHVQQLTTSRSKMASLLSYYNVTAYLEKVSFIGMLGTIQDRVLRSIVLYTLRVIYRVSCVYDARTRDHRAA